MTVTFTIPGKPFAKQRHRVGSFGGRARAFNTKDNERFESVIRTIAAPLFALPMDGPIRLTVEATFAPAESWSGKKKAAAIGQPHTQKPDLDNIAKAAKDGLNRIAWHDDSQVSELIMRKAWGPRAETTVTISAAD